MTRRTLFGLVSAIFAKHRGTISAPVLHRVWKAGAGDGIVITHHADTTAGPTLVFVPQGFADEIALAKSGLTAFPSAPGGAMRQRQDTASGWTGQPPGAEG